MPVLAVIPARLGSTRLANKPLQLLAGEPLIIRVAQRVASMGLADRVVVATDAAEIGVPVGKAGFEVAMTSPAHASGTDRVAEVAGRPEFRSFDVVVNVQGDEPFLPEAAVEGAVRRVRGGDDIGTASAPLDAAAARDPSRVKVVTDLAGHALYFSRAPIPYWRDGAAAPEGLYRQHLGIYAFGAAVLARWASLAPTILEHAEKLEQLRAMEHGFTIGVARLAEPALPGIDTADDLRRAEAHWHATQKGSR
ncbi:MAG: kdsB [Gemmatimonadetes bacterium]|nr:kdsB [Gemmatimonadota bacterium]